MKKRIFSKRVRLGGCALILIQTILLLLVSTWLVGNSYQNAWSHYLSSDNNYQLFLNKVPSQQKEEVMSLLTQYAQQDNLLIMRKDSGNTIAGQPSLNIGILGNTKNKNVTFSFLNTIY
ncbi:hypothetical protein [Ligilactobacillus salitolerans]|nr:hypothetical protein [Ligilactobacillus salitolerans]